MGTTQHWIGQTLAGRYRIRRLIGSGGMGTVFEGEHLELGKRVAIKILSATAKAPAEAEARLKQEARSASAVESEHIVNVYDVGRDPSAGLYMVMEYLDGEDLETRLAREGRLDVRTAVVIASQAARGLAKAHASGVVHRDLKPANIFLVPREDGSLLVKIVDFGIAKYRSEASSTATPGEGRITRDGAIVGTVQYMAPEQAQGLEAADHRVDIWALGTVLYECLAGRPAYEELGTYEQTLVHIVTTSPPELGNVAPDVPSSLASLVHTALRHDPNARPWDCFTFLRLLEEAMPTLFRGGGDFRLQTPGGVPLVPKGWPGGVPGWPAARVEAQMPVARPIPASVPRHGAAPAAHPSHESPRPGLVRADRSGEHGTLAPTTGNTVRIQPVTMETTNVGMVVGRPVQRRAQATLDDAEGVHVPGLRPRRGGLVFATMAVVAFAAVLGIAARRLEGPPKVAAAPVPVPSAATAPLPAVDAGVELAVAAPSASAKVEAPKPDPTKAMPRATTAHAPPVAHPPAKPASREIPLPNFPVPTEPPAAAVPQPTSAPPTPRPHAPTRPADSAPSEGTFGGVSVTETY